MGRTHEVSGVVVCGSVQPEAGKVWQHTSRTTRIDDPAAFGQEEDVVEHHEHG